VIRIDAYGKHLPKKKVEFHEALHLPSFRKQLQLIYDLACEMSHSNSYFEMDDDNEVIGRRQDIIDALNTVRKLFRPKGKVERP
jgi:hypothetical protein